MKSRIIINCYTLLLLLVAGNAFSQAPVNEETPSTSTLAPPKLVVGIIVDQMRYDYLYRFYNKYTDGGFKRLMREGFNCRNNHYHYAATITAPGHAHVYSGSTPAISGIIGNDWYDRQQGRIVYCVEDSTVSSVGNTSSAGKMSPRNLLVTTVTDQLKVASQGRSKVIGIAMKDRGAILPAGHAANAAYWFDSKDGSWVSSTFYMKELPRWMSDFNARRLSDHYLTQAWEPMLALNQYVESTVDDTSFENPLPGETRAVFPHHATVSLGSKYEALRTSPYGDVLTKELAVAALKGENLGKNEQTDFLCISFSSPDAIGHRFGPSSIEIQDEYLRLDRIVAELLLALDNQVGRGNYLLFLSADHGAADNPAYSQSLQIPAGSREERETLETANAAMKRAFGEGKWVKYYDNQQLYLDHDMLLSRKISLTDAYEVIKMELLKQTAVAQVVNFHNVNGVSMPEQWLTMLKNVYHPKRSGDIYVAYASGWLEGYKKGGTSHGTLYNYDTHVPLLLYGWGVHAGETNRRTHIADIAPTISVLLHIQEPSGTIGNPIVEVTN